MWRNPLIRMGAEESCSRREPWKGWPTIEKGAPSPNSQASYLDSVAIGRVLHKSIRSGNDHSRRLRGDKKRNRWRNAFKILVLFRTFSRRLFPRIHKGPFLETTYSIYFPKWVLFCVRNPAHLDSFQDSSAINSSQQVKLFVPGSADVSINAFRGAAPAYCDWATSLLGAIGGGRQILLRLIRPVHSLLIKHWPLIKLKTEVSSHSGRTNVFGSNSKKKR